MSPKRRWTLIAILYDTDEEISPAIAIGRWDAELVLAMRWNGTSENPIGNPQSRGLPTWFIVPSEFRDAILDKIPTDQRALAQTIFQQEDQQRNVVGVARRDDDTGRIIYRSPRREAK